MKPNLTKAEVDLQDDCNSVAGNATDGKGTVNLAGKWVYTMDLEAEPYLVIPDGPKGTKAIVKVSGKVYGPDINGEVIAPSNDWVTVGSDGILIGMDVNLVVRTHDDGQLLHMHVTGRSEREPDNPDNGVIRSAATWEAGPGKYQ